jgi:hypothetical protein
VLSLLVEPESQVRRISDALHQQAVTDPVAAEVLQLIPTILSTRFRDKSILEIRAMGGITLEDLSQSRAYQEIFGLGESRGEAKETLRLLARRCSSWRRWRQRCSTSAAQPTSPPGWPPRAEGGAHQMWCAAGISLGAFRTQGGQGPSPPSTAAAGTSPGAVAAAEPVALETQDDGESARAARGAPPAHAAAEGARRST